MQVSEDLERRLGLRLRQLRHERRWSLDLLAEKAGVSRAMLGQIERGRSAPTVRVLMRIAAGLGIDVTTLLAPTRRRRTPRAAAAPSSR